MYWSSWNVIVIGMLAPPPKATTGLPTPKDLSAALAHVGKHAESKKVAYENILWALLNTKEFVFNK